MRRAPLFLYSFLRIYLFLSFFFLFFFFCVFFSVRALARSVGLLCGKKYRGGFACGSVCRPCHTQYTGKTRRRSLGLDELEGLELDSNLEEPLKAVKKPLRRDSRQGFVGFTFFLKFFVKIFLFDFLCWTRLSGLTLHIHSGGAHVCPARVHDAGGPVALGLPIKRSFISISTPSWGVGLSAPQTRCDSSCRYTAPTHPLVFFHFFT